MFLLTLMCRKLMSCFLLYLLLAADCRSKRFRPMESTVHDVIWDPRETEALSVGKQFELEVHMRDYMNIFCPQYDPKASDVLQFIIYNVSEKSFNQCTASESEIIFKCDTPELGRKLTTKFQKRSPNPLGFIFIPNQTYYYIAFKKNETKTCETAMKLAVRVLPKRSHDHNRKPVTSIYKTTEKHTTTTKLASTQPTTTTIIPTRKPSPPKRSSVQPVSSKQSTPVVKSGDSQEQVGNPGNDAARVFSKITWLTLSSLLVVILQY
uniref:Ephrin RBD domain-containing protein n=1 Tax=Ciona savignyi TaxID=51511 RepID=H2Y9D9_CIOSA